MGNKKSLITLLIVLAIVLIAGGVYLFLLNRGGLDLSFLPWLKKEEVTTVSQIQQIEAAKRLTEQNLQDFVKSSRLDDLVGSQQYQNMQELDVSIDLDNLGNPRPFTAPPTNTVIQPGT